MDFFNLLRRLFRVKFSNLFLTCCCLFACLLLFDYCRSLIYPSTHGHRTQSNKRNHGNRPQLCHPPKLNLQNDTLQGFFHAIPPLRCSGESLMYLNQNILHINKTVLAHRRIKKCIYRSIERDGDHNLYSYSKPHIRTKPPFSIRIKHDFFRVSCFLIPPNSSVSDDLNTTEASFLDFDKDFEEKPDSDQIFAQVIQSPEIVERVAELEGSRSGRMNVLVVIVDSMSHMSFQRKMKRTYEYMEKLGGIVMNGYSVLDDGGAANIVPMLTGHKLEDLADTRRNSRTSTYIDKYPFIWYDYEQAGYVTQFAEDNEPALSTFNLRHNGFEQAPTDHYMRPFWKAVWSSSLNGLSSRYCLHNQPKHRYLLDYVRQFFITYPDKPKFSVVISGQLTHWNNNLAQYLDDDLADLLEELDKKTFLENTAVIMMSAHGALHSQVRHTQQGSLEERLPMLSLAFPAWFKHNHPEVIRNLELNANKMATPLDLYETLKDMMDVMKLDSPIDPRQKGVSLLRSIPTGRICHSAGIPLHYCTCLNHQHVQTTDSNVRQAASSIMSHMNNLLKDVGHKCSRLYLDSIEEASQIIPINKGTKKKTGKGQDQLGKQDDGIVQLQIRTTPNHGMYEATVETSGGVSKVLAISRVNTFGTDPHCIMLDRPDLRYFCHCKTALRGKSEGLGLDTQLGRV